MANIIAHGQVDGYRRINGDNTTPDIQVLSDIRTYLDHSINMLSKPAGYLIQMAPDGAWISIIKLMLDGERSGGGQGFMAFSAYISRTEMVDGPELKQILDGLMTKYVSEIATDQIQTRNKGVDWSFVYAAAAQLSALCQRRNKAAYTGYSPAATDFAYVDAAEADFAAYLGKPFQSEYGQYKAVALSNTVLNPEMQFACLAVDLNDIVYDIIWSGDVASHPYLPKTIKRNELATASIEVRKEYYHPATVSFANVEPNDRQQEIHVQVPTLQPMEFLMPVIAEPAEALTMLTAEYGQETVSLKDGYLLFRGEQVVKTWKVKTLVLKQYKLTAPIASIIPQQYMETGLPLRFTRYKNVYLRIEYEGRNESCKHQANIEFYGKNGLRPDYQSEHAALCYEIPETEDFSTYRVVARNGYNVKKQLTPQGNDLYLVELAKNRPSPAPPSEDKRTIKFVLGKGVDDADVEIKDPSHNTTQPLSSGNKLDATISLKFASNTHRNQLQAFSYSGKCKYRLIPSDTDEETVSLTKKFDVLSFLKDPKLLFAVAGAAVAALLIVLGIIVYAQFFKTKTPKEDPALTYLKKDEMIRDSLSFYRSKTICQQDLHSQVEAYYKIRDCIDNRKINEIKACYDNNKAYFFDLDVPFINSLAQDPSLLDTLKDVHSKEDDDIKKVYFCQLREELKIRGLLTSSSEAVGPVVSDLENLKAIYETAKTDWIAEDIKAALAQGNYDQRASDLQASDPNAYSYYLKITWLWKTRENIDSGNFDALRSRIAEKSRATDEVLTIITQMIDNPRSRENFRKETQKSDFKKKTFSEVKELWESYMQPSSKNGGGSSGSKGGSSSTSTGGNDKGPAKADGF